MVFLWRVLVAENDENQSADNRVNRAPVYACIIAAVFAVLLFLPGVLGYPGSASSSEVDESPAIEATEEANAILRERIALMNRILDEDVCVENGRLTTPTGPLPEELIEGLPGPPPSLREASAGATSHLNGFTGSVKDLLTETAVVIRVKQADGGSGSGSGTFIGPDLVVTNAHVVDGALPSEIYVFNKSVGGLQAELLATGEEMGKSKPDLAILRVNAPANHPYLAVADVDSGKSVISSTFPGLYLSRNVAFNQWLSDPNSPPGNIGPLIGTGIANIVITENDGHEYVWHDAMSDSGSSGGTIADNCGRLVGVHVGATYRQEDPDEQGVVKSAPRFPKAVSAATLRKFMSDEGLPALVHDTTDCK